MNNFSHGCFLPKKDERDEAGPPAKPAFDAVQGGPAALLLATGHAFA